MPYHRRIEMLALAILVIMAMMLGHPGGIAFGQDREAIRALFPATLLGLELSYYADDDWMMRHRGRVVQGELPVHRVSAAYSDGIERNIFVHFLMANPGLAGLFSDPHHGALELASLEVGQLQRSEMDGLTLFEGSVVIETPGEPEETLRLVVSLRGHAVIAMETILPGRLTLDLLKESLSELDLAAFQAIADTFSDDNGPLWTTLSLLPENVLGEPRTALYIESDGKRKGRDIMVMGGYGGEPANPALVFSVVALSDGRYQPEELRAMFGIGPDIEPDRMVQGRPLFKTLMEDRAAAALLGESGIVWLMANYQVSARILADVLEAMDIDTVFDVIRSFSLASSEKAMPTPSAYESGELRLVSWAHVVDEGMLEYFDEVGNEYLIVRKGHPVLDGLSPMSILVAPDFLRRVVVIENLGERLRFHTVVAGLEEIMRP
jgi:hypothetical protein